MRPRERGSISFACLLIALLLLVLAQLLTLWCAREAAKVDSFFKDEQLRLLCGSVFMAIAQRQWPAGDYVWYEGSLQPGQTAVKVSGNSSYSADGLLDRLEVQAATAETTFKLRRLQLRVNSSQQRLAASYALVSSSLTGAEYLTEAVNYTSTDMEEVTLPKVAFMKGSCATALTNTEVATEGLSGLWYYLSSGSELKLTTTERIKGPSVLVNKGSITLGAGCSYPDRLVLISESGNITLQQQASLGRALIMAKGSITVGSGCRINGLLIAPRIYLQGSSEFTPDASVVAPFASVVFPSS